MSVAVGIAQPGRALAAGGDRDEDPSGAPCRRSRRRRQRGFAPVAQLADDELALDLQPDDEEEQRHQPVVDPVPEVEVERPRAPERHVSVARGAFAQTIATTAATSTASPLAAASREDSTSGSAAWRSLIGRGSARRARGRSRAGDQADDAAVVDDRDDEHAVVQEDLGDLHVGVVRVDVDVLGVHVLPDRLDPAGLALLERLVERARRKPASLSCSRYPGNSAAMNSRSPKMPAKRSRRRHRKRRQAALEQPPDGRLDRVVGVQHGGSVQSELADRLGLMRTSA